MTTSPDSTTNPVAPAAAKPAGQDNTYQLDEGRGGGAGGGGGDSGGGRAAAVAGGGAAAAAGGGTATAAAGGGASAVAAAVGGTKRRPSKDSDLQNTKNLFKALTNGKVRTVQQILDSGEFCV